MCGSIFKGRPLGWLKASLFTHFMTQLQVSQNGAYIRGLFQRSQFFSDMCKFVNAEQELLSISKFFEG